MSCVVVDVRGVGGLLWDDNGWWKVVFEAIIGFRMGGLVD